MQVTISGTVHPSIKRSVNIIAAYFDELQIKSQEFLGTPEKCEKVICINVLLLNVLLKCI